MRKIWLTSVIFLFTLTATAQEDSLKTATLDGVTVSARRSGTSRLAGAVNGIRVNREELFRAACCNLGESFTTNPSVDVNYSDAATGAKQIKLLGLSGTYVQMLTENLPNFRGAAFPYALGYVPGPWMQSIQVSKGASSVRNGYESITGQINIEYLKPEDEEGVAVNLYGNTKSRLEANADANIHVGKVNTELLAHYENDWGHHDDNDDGFYDKPNIRQVNIQNRWDYIGSHYIFHGGISLLDERREGGQIAVHHSPSDYETSTMNYELNQSTHRYEAYMKHALLLNPERGTNIALMASGSLHQLEALYGNKTYSVNEKNAYAQLMFETNLGEIHNLSAGLSLNHDYFHHDDKETTPGAYVQYTLNLNERLTLMAGIRADHSSRYGWFGTPRIHLKYMPHEIVTLRLSAGKGYRTPHALAENNYLLASGRQLVIDDLEQESAWNYGLSAALNIPIGNKTLKVNAEYYYTHFIRQMLVDYDSDIREIRLTNLRGRSYSHTFQIDATYPVIDGLEVTAAYRLNDVKSTYGGQLMEKPLQSRYKALLTASYKLPPGLWQFDVTFQQNGGGRLPSSIHTLTGSCFPAYPQLNAQVTRWFRHFSVYIGGENLTNYRQPHPIWGTDDPWGKEFEPTMVWGPVHGLTFYAGIRLNFGKRL
ncbi:MAG: TonB-dependent receptor [Prevotella sp.]|nr:TonB-dependent receptor [Prevotella sp.]